MANDGKPGRGRDSKRRYGNYGNKGYGLGMPWMSGAGKNKNPAPNPGQNPASNPAGTPPENPAVNPAVAGKGQPGIAGGDQAQRRPKYGSDVIVDLLREAGIEYIAFNPGASFRGLHDSLVNYGPDLPPEIILCCHESVAVALAHGYAKASGKMMAAAAHNLVGLQHATIAIYNAWVERVPILVLGGTGPMDTTLRRPRQDWIHTALVQGNLVRDFVKWDDQPASVRSIPDSIRRAVRLARTQPTAPVYLCFDAAHQEQELTPEDLADLAVLPEPGPARLLPPQAPTAPQPVIERLALDLVQARWPVIIADRCGREPSSFYALAELADLLATPVLDRCTRLNFPSSHPMDMTGNEAESLGRADLVLALDVNDLYGSLHDTDMKTRGMKSLVGPNLHLVSVTLDDYLVRSWATDFRRLQLVDQAITADTAVLLPELLRCCRRLLADTGPGAGTGQGAATASGAGTGKADPAEWRRVIENRRKEIADRHQALRAAWRQQAEQAEREVGKRPPDREGIRIETLALHLGQVIEEEDWSLVNGRLGGWTRRLWNFDRHYRYMGDHAGGGVGCGLGAAIGTALAYRGTGRLCVDIQADGDLLYTASALWTAAHHRIPMLMVMNNNRSYYNSEDHQYVVARKRGRPMERAGIGTKLDEPEIDYAAMARAQGLKAYGPVKNVAQLETVLVQAARHVRESGMPVLVDVHTRPY